MGLEIDIVKMAGDAVKGVGDAAMAAGKGIEDFANESGRRITEATKAVGDAAAGAVNAAGSVVTSVMPGGEKSLITQDQMGELLDICYAKALDGIPNVSQPIDELVQDYSSKYNDTADAAKAMVNMQLVKNTTSGFLSGLAGCLALPVTLASIPANIGNVLYVQIRMVAALAKMGGYDVRSDQVQTMVYVCLVGNSAGDVLKEAGIKAAGKFAQSAIEKIPGAVLTKINQAVGFRLVTKFGEKGIVNLGKMIPVVGGFVGGAFDFTSTRIIANVAYDRFIGNGTGDVIDDETLDIIASEGDCEVDIVVEDTESDSVS